MAPFFLLTVLSILAPAGAAVDVTAHLQATRVETAAGRLDGELSGSLWASGEPGPLPWVSLAATRATVTVDQALREMQWQDGPAGNVSLQPTKESTQGPSTYTDVALDEAAVVSPARVLLLPIPGRALPAARIDDGVALAPGAGTDVLEPRSAALSAPDFRLPVAQAFEATVTGGALRVTGDVRIVVTGLALAFTSEQGDVAVDTGAHDQPAFGPPSNPLRRQEASEAVIDLEGADLLVPAGSAWFLAATIEAPEVGLHGADGTLRWLGTQQRLDRDEVVLSGDPRLELARSPEGTLDARLGGSLSAMAIGGDSIALRGEDTWQPPPAVWFGLVAFALVTYALLGRQLFRDIDLALAGRRYGDVLALVRFLRMHPWHRQDAALAAALSLTELGRPGEARERLLAKAQWAPSRQATRDFLLARASARLGDHGETLRRLAASLLADPGLLAQARADPVLASVVAPWTDSAEAPSSSIAAEAYA